MQKISYGFMNPYDGRFLHAFEFEDDADNCGMGVAYKFTVDANDPIYETEEAAAILDTLIGAQGGCFLSQEALSGCLPAAFDVSIKDFVPVAFMRDLMPIVDGGEELVTAMTVRLVRFENTADPNSLWLDDIKNRFETNPNTGIKIGIG